MTHQIDTTKTGLPIATLSKAGGQSPAVNNIYLLLALVQADAVKSSLSKQKDESKRKVASIILENAMKEAQNQSGQGVQAARGARIYLEKLIKEYSGTTDYSMLMVLNELKGMRTSVKRSEDFMQKQLDEMREIKAELKRDYGVTIGADGKLNIDPNGPLGKAQKNVESLQADAKKLAIAIGVATVALAAAKAMSWVPFAGQAAVIAAAATLAALVAKEATTLIAIGRAVKKVNKMTEEVNDLAEKIQKNNVALQQEMIAFKKTISGDTAALISKAMIERVDSEAQIQVLQSIIESAMNSTDFMAV